MKHLFRWHPLVTVSPKSRKADYFMSAINVPYVVTERNAVKPCVPRHETRWWGCGTQGQCARCICRTTSPRVCTAAGRATWPCRPCRQVACLPIGSRPSAQFPTEGSGGSAMCSRHTGWQRHNQMPNARSLRIVRFASMSRAPGSIMLYHHSICTVCCAMAKWRTCILFLYGLWGRQQMSTHMSGLAPAN